MQHADTQYIAGGGNNKSFHAAKRAKEDEFYTQLTDIEKELKYYKKHFKDKVVFCNCDDPEESNFWVYFRDNFAYLGLKKLISTHYEEGKQSYKMELTGARYDDGELKFDNFVKTPLQGDGDFRSDECVEILKEADIVVTNPPFSLFREYVAQLMEYNKSFLIIGNQNNIVYKEIFPLMRQNKIWLGYKSGDMAFRVPSYFEPRATRYWQDESGQKWRSMGNICWFTNLDHNKRHESLILYKSYSQDEYPTYDNYNAINVDKTKEIPRDYDGIMGVPVTFLDKYNPDQFEILGLTSSSKELTGGIMHTNSDTTRAHINGKLFYARILVKRKH